jgi:SAM-dependent methyltransferase
MSPTFSPHDRPAYKSNPSNRNRKTAIVINAFNQAHFLSDAIESCLRQTVEIDEIIVVDDGSTDDTASVVARYPNVRLIRQDNRGLAAARNTGLAATDATYVTFLDADDLLLPAALELGIRQLSAQPQAAMVYGAHRMVDARKRPISGKIYIPVSGDAYLQFLRRGNFIGMHATVVYRREHLVALGGFDESFPSCEDYELFLRIAKTRPIISHEQLVAEYRKHSQNMSYDYPKMLATALRAIDLQLGSDSMPATELRSAIAAGRIFWTDCYSVTAKRPLFRGQARLGKLLPFLGRRMPEEIWTPAIGHVKLGDFSRTRPISSCFGFDRGKPIDRYYIEKFLADRTSDIRGRVLEIGDNSYTKQFGSTNVSKSDVLHVNASNPKATIVGDLSETGILAQAAFDCIILTQTLHLIYDMRRALANVARSLKPDGVLLITVPGVSPVDRADWGYTWYWSLTELALAHLLVEIFDPRDFCTAKFGNVFAAVSFLHGLAVSEVPAAKLDVVDPAFPVVIGARAVRRERK